MTLNEDGTITQNSIYEPFGKQIPLMDGTNSRLGFISKEKDIESSLGDFGVRKYDEEIGRFTSIDPLWEKYLGYTPYHYCGGNPLMSLDPTGFASFFTPKGNVYNDGIDNDCNYVTSDYTVVYCTDADGNIDYEWLASLSYYLPESEVLEKLLDKNHHRSSLPGEDKFENGSVGNDKAFFWGGQIKSYTNKRPNATEAVKKALEDYRVLYGTKAIPLFFAHDHPIGFGEEPSEDGLSDRTTVGTAGIYGVLIYGDKVTFFGQSKDYDAVFTKDRLRELFLK